MQETAGDFPENGEQIEQNSVIILDVINLRLKTHTLAYGIKAAFSFYITIYLSLHIFAEIRIFRQQSEISNFNL